MVTERKSKQRKNRVTLRTYAKTMRHVPTDAEKKFWWMVRDRRLGGYKFKRQYPFGNYIADFICLEVKLIVELDGGQHAEQRDYDAKSLRGKEYSAVARQLLAQLDGGETPSPQPSPPLCGGEGEALP